MGLMGALADVSERILYGIRDLVPTMSTLYPRDPSWLPM